MALPYPTKVVLPFDIATAQDMNERHANDVALANGSGLDDGSVTPGKRSGGYKTGVISGGTLSTVGNKNITGVGFKPRMVEFQGLPASAGNNLLACTGVMDESGTQSTTAIAAGVGTGELKRNSSTTACIGFITPSVSTFALLASFVSMNGDGFTINVSIPNAGLDISYKAYA